MGVRVVKTRLWKMKSLREVFPVTGGWRLETGDWGLEIGDWWVGESGSRGD
jgi:hypothetical protein